MSCWKGGIVFTNASMIKQKKKGVHHTRIEKLK